MKILSMITEGKHALESLDLNSGALSAAGQAMAELGISGCTGSLCVKTNILTPDVIATLSKTTFSILLPLFLCTSMIKTIGTHSIGRSSIAVPIIAILHCLFLYIISTNFLLAAFGIDSLTNTGRSTAVTCSWGNSGVVPLIFAESLFRNSEFHISKAYYYVALYLVGWSPFFWSFGKHILIDQQSTNESPEALDEIHESTFKEKIQILKSILPPPVIGVFSGLFISLSPLLSIVWSSTKKKALLSFVYNSLQNLGSAANPLSLLVLTSSLASGRKCAVERHDDYNSDIESVSFLQKWFCVSIARFILSPLLMFFLLKFASNMGIVGAPKTDPMLWFIMILQSCMPSAQNAVLMLQVADRPKEASDMATFLFSIYATAMLPLIITITALLQLLDLA
mmetsp:Transcript_10497/g.14823  ORF Transcript_10497/g.14823 Transcript_10497/m.14823 type:complete len:396 (+) Transcript_10497:97-1284(+)